MRKRRQHEQPPPSSETPEVVEGFVERPVEDTPTVVGRLTIYTNDQGQIDWDRTKVSSEELVNLVANDPETLEKIAEHPDFQDDGSGGPALEDPTAWKISEAGFVLDALAKIEGFLLARVSKPVLGMNVESKYAMMAFSLTEQDHQEQDPLAKALLDEYARIDPKYRIPGLLAIAQAKMIARNTKEACKLQMLADGKMASVELKPNGKESTNKPI